MTGRSREPRAIGAELADVLRARGWDDRLAAARVVARWPAVVGDAVAAHCQPSRLDEDGTLRVVADSACTVVFEPEDDRGWDAAAARLRRRTTGDNYRDR